ncbi:PEP-CTERM sorting domain-containing protein [Massilia forsythiae]|uniref:PEP-CTERM sorting domain-containing protein n=1 Tax=Massilia forsythiae TaxID=2728020 RepID=A0A7Z2ZVX3_9BURK|nr:PEP-CTERM sorting domain-containing protein [Massilia forsythiae]QJE02577.1 PEP-CTERM sorting domain-containing protein [Massilia forsythiae]
MPLNAIRKMLAGVSLFACASVFAAPLTVNLAGIQSNGIAGNPDNTVQTYDVGANATITSIAYAVGLSAFGTSWLSDIGLAFTNSDGTGVLFNPGLGNDGPGTASYAGNIDLADLGLDFNVGADGILRLEFYDYYDDLAGADGRWDSGAITFGVASATTQDVPEPATALLLGGGLALMGYAGRRKASNGAASNGAAPAGR